MILSGRHREPNTKRNNLVALGKVATATLLLTTALLPFGASAGVPQPTSLPPAKPEIPSGTIAVSRALSTSDKLLKSAIEQAQLGEHEKAAALAAASGDPLGAKVVEWLSLTQTTRDVAFAEVAAFIAANPGWPSLSVMQRHAEAGLGLDPSPTLPDEAILAWFQAGPASPLSPKTSNGAASFAAALMRQGRKDEASAVVRNLWVDMDLDNEKSEEIFLQRFANFLTKDDQQARLERLLWQRKEAPAYRQAKRLGRDYYALARARMALAYGRGGVDSAIRAVPKALQNDSGLLYDRARWRLRRGLYEGVVELVDPPQPELTNAERWWPIREWTARKALRAGDIDLAYRIASNHGLTSGVGFAEGQWLAGWIALKELKRPDEAFDHFVRLYNGVKSPISLARGAYWAGVAAEARDDDATAKTWFERAATYSTAFYGQRAAAQLGMAVEIATTDPTRPDAQGIASFQAKELVAVVHLLDRVEAEWLEGKFLYHMLSQAEDGQELRMIADLAADVGRQEIAVRTAKLARSRGFTMNDHLYPELALPGDGGPGDAGPEQALVLALIRQESAFNSKAVSRAGARGLMQLMPATARLVAKQTGEAFSTTWLTSDPDYNIRLGRAYLKSMLERFDGAYVLALASYNAGPHRVDRWLETNGDPRQDNVDIVDWIEQIPFDETRNYVQRILESLTVYRDKSHSSQSSSLWSTAGSAS